MSSTCAEMPRYRCHKEVWALKIAEVIRVQEPTFEKAVCKGCEELRNNCGHCERCLWRKENRHPDWGHRP